MAWEEERFVFASKLHQIINGINRIENLKSNRIVTPEMSRDLHKKSAEAVKLLPKLEEEVFEIAVVGLEKAGKSSFANALTGLAVLPTASQRCTYTSTCIRSGETNRAIINFYSKSEFDQSFAEKLALLKIPDVERYNVRNLDLRKYEQLFDECDPDTKKLYAENVNLDIRDILANRHELEKYIGHAAMKFEGPELESENFASFIKDPSRAIAVKDVTIYSTELSDMPNAVIYDVPGFDSPTAMHKEQTLQKMRDADAIIMVAAADRPSLTSPALSIFKENVDDYGCQLDEKLFVFANKADTVASKDELENNIRVTHSEWIDKWGIMHRRYEDRIIFGSANAHLGEKVHKGLEYRAILESYGFEPGIDKLRSKIYDYYHNERFDVLKKRVTSILQEVKNVFKEVDKDFEGSPRFSYQATIRMAMEMCDSLRVTLKKALEDIKYNLGEESNLQKPLKKDISQRIRDSLSLEKYQLTDSEIEEMKKELPNTSHTPMPLQINPLARQKRFRQMHPEFTQDILGCAVNRHNEVANAILDAFMETMQVGKSRPEYEDLRRDSAIFCGLDKDEDEFYYRSLIERFSRDLFEIHILMPHGKDRIDKFISEAPNFLSLGVFYEQDKPEGESTGSLPQNPLESRLWRMILYPEIVRDEGASPVDANPIMEFVKKKSGLKQLEPVIESMILSIVRNRGNLAAAAIEEALSLIRPGGSPRIVSAKVREALQSLTTEDGAASLQDILYGTKYLDDRHARELDYNYEQVKSDFSDDVIALREGLLRAFVPAIDLDKAFNAKESSFIEKIITDLRDDKFYDFVADNLEIIKKDEMDSILGEMDQKELDRAVMQQIKTILAEISSAPVK